jgi:Protein of unknown function (DUF2442)
MAITGLNAEVVTCVRVVRHGVVVLTFADGLQGEVDLLDELWGPVFERARTPEGFSQVYVDEETRTIAWPPGDADLAPDTLYQRVKTGEWPEDLPPDA